MTTLFDALGLSLGRELIAGLFGDRCRVERPDGYVKDAEGNPVAQWATAVLCDCDVQHGSGGQQWNRNREEGKQGARIFLPLADIAQELENGLVIDSTCRIVREATGMVYNVVGAAQPDSDDLALTVTCQLPNEESRNA